MSYFSLPRTAAEVQDEIAASARARRLARNLTQDELARRSGVAIATLRRFEGGGPASLSTVLAIAEALEALDGFSTLFPLPEAKSLDELDASARRRRRAAGRKKG
ncbi:helix-turn-helix transcriptional regulator [Gluconacetobacter aggeris]|uniref:Helix-turn-helix transcriptional regulator n=1 Tax=Gluconacetobacter aggeris TaxID=1286186 RepID=A0A7W4IPS5_9PROT|nr:helix-turn-helix transcriptional regulator [Gluconacetobacter aggeris]MBB2166821.1 helix-turn-helix transcriptional regulator [Gluconacetobacter aggeris]